MDKSDLLVEVGKSLNQRYFSIKNIVEKKAAEEGMLLSLKLVNMKKEVVSNNFYWLPNKDGNYYGLNNMPLSISSYSAEKKENDSIEVMIKNEKNGPVSFFNRISLIDNRTGKRILPVFYSNNYISVLPGESQKVILKYPKNTDLKNSSVTIESWNHPITKIPII